MGKTTVVKCRIVRRVVVYCLIAFMVLPTSVLANPSGEQVVSGSAAFARSGATLNVSQGSNSAIIDWQNFSIAAGETTNFLQPSATSAVLNRVTSNNPSQIYGNLTANGQVFLVNQNGILVGASGVIDTNGFVASTLDVSNEEFLSGGDLNFLGDSENSVINLGQINAVGGDVLLIARDVQNSGEITATNGTVALAAGSEVLVRASGAERVFIQAGSSAGSVSNSGLIDSASAELKAMGGNEFALAVNNDGAIRANSVEERGGRIWLVTDQGTVENSGTLIATQGDKGGEVQVLGDRVALTGDALVDVSGDQGGGTALIGGDFQGNNDAVRNAAKVYIGADAQINANALVAGDGGKVIVWSDDTTQFYGDISAKGGMASGDGGFVEVSGKKGLDFRGAVDTSATFGQAGTLLLDPADLTITTVDANVTGVTPFEASAAAATLSVTVLQDALALGNVTVQTSNDGFAGTGEITVASNIGWFSSNTLTISSYNNINVNANISAFEGSLVLEAGTSGSAGAISLGNDVKVMMLEGDLTATAYGAITEEAIGAGVKQGYFLIAGTSSFTSSHGSVSLGAADNKFTGDVSITSGDAGSILLYNDRATSLGAIAGAGTGGVAITSNGNISSASSFNSAGTVTLETAASSNGSILMTDSFAAADVVSLSTDGLGAISIADINGNLSFNTVTADGSITLGNGDTGALTFDSAGGNVLEANSNGTAASGNVAVTGSSIAVNDSFRTRGGALNLTATTGTVTAALGANLTTTADGDTGTASGSVNVQAATGVTLQNVVTSGADNTIGVGSNAASVTISSTAGDIAVGEITTTGGAATAGATTNRNGGNAGNITLGASGGNIHLNGDLNAVGGSFVGTATQGLGGYIELQTPTILEGDRTVSSGATSGDIYFLDTIDSDDTSRSLTVTGGSGDVVFNGVVGGAAVLTSVNVSSSKETRIEENLTTDGAAGLDVTATTLYLGDAVDDDAIVIDTEAGNGVVDINTSVATYLDDDVTFTRGSGEVNFSSDVYSKDSERNDLTFNGVGGGVIYVGRYVGGTSELANTKLGDVLVSTGTDLTFNYHVSAKSLRANNSTGRLYVGGSASSGYHQWYDGAYGLQLSTDGSNNIVGSDENITVNSYVSVTENTAPITISATNGAVTLNSNADLSTQGGDISLIAGVGALTLGGDSDITSSGGLITLAGVGVQQTSSNHTSAVVNSGSGKIRIDGGGQAVTLRTGLISTDNDSLEGGIVSPAILITNTAGTTLRNVTATTGTLQVGMVGESDSVAATQALSAGDAVLTANTSYYAPRRITLTSSGADSAKTFTITGTDVNGDVLVENISGADSGTVTTVNYFKTVDSISIDLDSAGTVTAGLALEEASGSLSQYQYYSNDKFDIKTLSAAASDSISITSTSNIIDELGDFSVGSSLDVRASGRSTGMALTGDVAATSVIIKTGNGALAIGDRSITSTSGDITLQGLGITQGSGSVIDSADQVELWGRDYADGTIGSILLDGTIQSASTTAYQSIKIWATDELRLGDITAGSNGLGGLWLGDSNIDDYSGPDYYRYVEGAITQTAGTSLDIGMLRIYQRNGLGGITLTNEANEIADLNYIYRNGAVSIYDKDTVGNGLDIISSISDGTDTNTVTLETTGLMTSNSSWIEGDSVILSAGSGLAAGDPSFSGSFYIDARRGAGDIVFLAHGGDVTLTGELRNDGVNDDLIIRNADAVQLSYLRYLDGEIQLGSAADAESVAVGQEVTTSSLTLVGGGITFENPERVAITSGSDVSAVSFTVEGTDIFGRTQTEIINNVNGDTIAGNKYFATITSITPDAASVGNNITVGTALENIEGDVTQTSNINTDSTTSTLTGIVDGSLTLTDANNDFVYIDDLTVGNDLTLVSQARWADTLHISGDVVSTTGNIDISNYYFHLNLDNTGSVTSSAIDSSVTLRASDNSYNGYDANILGPVVAGTGGINILSDRGDVYTSGLGTLTTTGTATLSSNTNYTTNIRAAVQADAGIDINSGGTVTTGDSGTLTVSDGTITIDSGDYDAVSLGAVVEASDAITVVSRGSFTNTADMISNGTITIDSGYGINNSNNYFTSIQAPISAGEGGTGNIDISARGAFANTAAGTLTATGFVSLLTYWNTTYENERDLTLGGNITAGADGIKVTSSGIIDQIGGILSTTGTLSGPNQSGGSTPTASLPSARGAITLNGANEVANLGPFYLYDEAGVDFSFNDVSGGLTLAGTIENSHGSVTINTQGGALNLATHDVYAGGMATGGADISLAGQGIEQSAGSDINTTGGVTGTARTGANGGGTITLTGHDGTDSGAIVLSGGVETVNASDAAVTIRGTSDLQLPSINAVNGTLVLGDDTLTIGQISGNITQAVGTALDINALTLGTATNAIGGSAVLANVSNKISELGTINTGAHQFVGPATDIQYDLDIYDSTGGLTVTEDVVSAEGIRITTTDATTGALTLGTSSVLASGDVYLGGLTVTQADGSTINADNSAGAGTGGSIRIDGGGGTNNITLGGVVTTDNTSGTAIEIVNADNATLNTVSATAGTVALGVDTKELTGTVSQVDGSSLLSAQTLEGDAGLVTIDLSEIDNVGPLTTTGSLTLKDQGGAGTAGLKLTGTVTTGDTTVIESSDGVLDLDTQTLDATGQAITLKGVGLSQQAASTILSTTADLYGGTGDIDLFSVTNDFTGQVTVHSTGSQVSVQDANQLSMAALTGVLDPTTSVQLWAGSQLSLTTENLTTTSGSIEFKSLGDILNTPGKLTTGSGDISLYADTTLSLAEKILSTSGNITIDGAVIASRAGAEDYIKTAGAGSIDITARTGNFTQGSDVLYQTVDGDITLTALAGNATLAKIDSTTGGLNVTAGGNILQLSGAAITVDSIDALTKTDGAGDITLTESVNNAANIRLRTLNAAGDTTVGGVVQYEDADGFAVQEILTTANTTLTARGDITADNASGNPGTVTADMLTVKTLLDAGAGVALDHGNNVNTLNIKVRSTDDSTITGETTTPTGTIRFTDIDGFVISSIETGGTTVLTAGDSVTQTGAIDSVKLGLSGAGDYTLNAADVGIPVNQVSTFASDASGAVNLTSQLALTIGAVNPTGITSNGADVSISAPTINSTGYVINTSSSDDGTAGGIVSLTTTGSNADGNLTVGSIITSGTDATLASGSGGGAAGNITLIASGDELTITGAISARGGAGDGAGIDGANGTVKTFATSGAVSQLDGGNEIDSGRLLVDALSASRLLDTDNTIDQVAVKISGVGQDFIYRSGAGYEIGGGESGISGIETMGGAVDLSNSDVDIIVSEAIITNGGSVLVTDIRSFDSAPVSINTSGDVTYASGAYKDGGDITITTTANGGAITTGTLVASGDVNNAGDATSGVIALNADGILTIATTSALGKGTGVGGDVTLTGSEVHIGGSVDTSSTASSGGAINIVGPAVVIDGDRALATGAGGGNISFSSTLNSDGSARGLSITAGTGNILFSGAIGGSAPLAALNIVSATDVTANSTLDAASLTQQAGTGTTSLNGATTLSGNLSFTGTNLTLNDSVDVGGTTTITNAGLFTTAAAGNIISVGAVTQNGAGLNALAGDITTTNTDIDFATGVLLNDDVVLGTDTGIGTITFAQVVNSDLTARDLTLNTGTGDATFTAAVGGLSALDAIIVNTGGVTTFDDAVVAASVWTDAAGSVAIDGATVTTTGTQTYNENITLGDNTVLTGSTVTTNGTVDALSHSLTVAGNAVFGDASGDTVTGLTTLDVSGTTLINTATVTSADAQTYSGAVIIGNDTTLTTTDDAVLFSSTVDSQIGEDNGLAVTVGSGDITFTDAVGATVNGELGAFVTQSTGNINIDGGRVETTGVQTYNGDVIIGANTVMNSGGTVTFAEGIDSDASQTYDLSISATNQDIVFTGAVGATDVINALTIADAKDVTFSNTLNAGSLLQQAGSGTTTFNDATTLTGDLDFTGTGLTINDAVDVGGSVAVTNSGLFSTSAASTIDAEGGLTQDGSGNNALAGDITTTGTDINFATAVTLTDDVSMSTGTTAGEIVFGSTVDSDADLTPRSLRLTSGDVAGQNFVAAVGGIHALNILRIESVGVTQGGSAPIKAASVAIKSSAAATLTNSGNDINTLAALLSGDASLVFVDANGVAIGTIDSDELQIVGITDGAGTSNVDLTVGGLLSQTVGSIVAIDGDMTIDASSFDAGNVQFTNTDVDGTVLDNSLIAGDFDMSSAGDVTQLVDANGVAPDQTDAYIQVGGEFNVTGGGAFIEGDSPDNLIGGGSGTGAANEIRLYGVITLSVNGSGDLLASATDGTVTTNDTILKADQADGVFVVSDAGGKSIADGGNDAVNAVVLTDDNQIGGNLKITTKGSYSNSGSDVATGIRQTSALDLQAASFTVQESAENATSVVTGAGELMLDDATNAFGGTVSASAANMDAHIAAATDIELGNVRTGNLTVETDQAISQASTSNITTTTLSLLNAASTTLMGENNRVGVVAADLNGPLSLANKQALTVGTVGVAGVTSVGSVLLQTTDGDLTLNEDITVTGAANITLVSAGNFINNQGVGAMTVDTGHWQVWSTDPVADTLGGLTPNYKQYNATYGSSVVQGTGNGFLYTLAPELTVALTGSVERVYNADVDATLAQSNYIVTGLIDVDGPGGNAGDTVLLSTVGTFDNKNVATDKTITVENVSIVSAANGGVTVYGYTLAAGMESITGDIGTITPATISAVTGIAADDKSYDGGTVATLNTGSAGFTDMFVGDVLTVGSVNGAFVDQNVADAIQVDVTDIVLAGTDAGNYTLADDTATTAADITPYAVSLTGSRVYDGTDVVANDIFTMGALVGTETLTLSGSGTLTSKNVVTNGAVTLGTLALGDGSNGGVASNYSFSDGSQTASVTAAPITINSLDVTRDYDGSLNAAGTATITSGTFYDSISGGNFAFTDANAGINKTVTTDAVTITDGNSGGNYDVTYANNTTSTINKAALVVSTSDVTKTYDGGLTALGTAVVETGTLYHNASNGGVLDSLSGGTFAFVDANAGSGNKVVTATGATVNDGNGGGNYDVTYTDNITSTINQYAVDLNGSRIYDGSNIIDASTLTLGSLVGTETLALNGSGTLASKNVVTNGAISLGSLILSDGSGLASNYTFSGGTQNATITAAPLTLTTSDVTKTYNGSLAAAGTAMIDTTSGTVLFGTDSISGGSFAYADANAGSNKTVTTSGVTVSDGNGGGNYSVSYTNNTSSTINQAAITISSSDVVRDYDGTLNAAGNGAVTSGTLYANASNGGVVDSLSGGSFAFVDANAGTDKTVTVSGVTIDDSAGGANYTVTYADNVTSTINQADISIATTDVSKTYDGTLSANGSASVVAGTLYTNVSNGGEADRLSGGSFAFTDANVGMGKTVTTTAVTITDGAGGGNYNIHYVDNTSSTITPAALTVAAVDDTKTYDAAAYVGGNGVTYSGFVNAEDQSVLAGSISYSGSSQGAVDAGTYVITPQGVASGNYDITFTDAALTVDKAMLTYVANSAAREYGESNPVVSGSVTGFVGMDTLAALGGSVSWATPALLDSDAGSHAINGSGYTSGNYDFEQAVGNATALTIDKATLTYVSDINTIEYGDENPSLTGSVSGFKLGQDTTDLGGRVEWVPSSLATSDVGVYGVTGTGYSSTNYAFVQAAGNVTALTVEPATLTYTADEIVREYGDANPNLSGTITGLKNNELVTDVTSGELVWMTSASSSSDVGNYPIYGFGLNVVDSNYNLVIEQAAANDTIINVTPATLQFVADAVSRQYGNENPALSGHITGFKNDEEVSDLGGSIHWGTTATVTSDVGRYAVNGSGLTSSNYQFDQAASNAMALTVLATTVDVGGVEVPIVNEGGDWQLVNRDDNLILIDSRNPSFVSIDEIAQNHLDDQMAFPELALLQQLPDFMIEFEQAEDFSFGNVYSAVSTFADEEPSSDLGFGAYYHGAQEDDNRERPDYLN